MLYTLHCLDVPIKSGDFEKWAENILWNHYHLAAEGSVITNTSSLQRLTEFSISIYAVHLASSFSSLLYAVTHCQYVVDGIWLLLYCYAFFCLLSSFLPFTQSHTSHRLWHVACKHHTFISTLSLSSEEIPRALMLSEIATEKTAETHLCYIFSHSFLTANTWQNDRSRE